MQKFIVTGGVPLNGEVRIAGAKNAVLKMMAAAVLTASSDTPVSIPSPFSMYTRSSVARFPDAPGA